MPEIPSARQEQILKWLKESRTLSIDELVERLGVSVMTVHRDLDTLARSGVAEKVHGGATLAVPKSTPIPMAPVCRLCGMNAAARTAFLIQTREGEQVDACCPHCALLLLRDYPTVTSALTRDFIYGRMVNAFQAVYLLECDIHICCIPSALCFASLEDATRFQAGFGGKVMNFSEAQAYMADQHQQVYSGEQR